MIVVGKLQKRRAHRDDFRGGGGALFRGSFLSRLRPAPWASDEHAVCEKHRRFAALCRGRANTVGGADKQQRLWAARLARGTPRDVGEQLLRTAFWRLAKSAGHENFFYIPGPGAVYYPPMGRTKLTICNTGQDPSEH